MNGESAVTVYDEIKEFLKDLSQNEASYFLIGPRGLTSELGTISLFVAQEKAREFSRLYSGVKLYVRGGVGIGSQQVNF